MKAARDCTLSVSLEFQNFSAFTTARTYLAVKGVSAMKKLVKATFGSGATLCASTAFADGKTKVEPGKTPTDEGSHDKHGH